MGLLVAVAIAAARAAAAPCNATTHYESVPPGALVDRVCAPLTQCNAGFKLVRNGGPGVCAACPPQHYVASSGPHRIQTCTRQDACGRGKKFVDSQTAKTSCAPCDAETWRDEPTHRYTFCKPWTVCDPAKGLANFSDGELYPVGPILPPTAFSDRPCQTTRECDLTFDEFEQVALNVDRGIARQCAPLRTCNAGTYVSRQPSISSDRMCAECPDGQYTGFTPNKDECTPYRLCDPVAGNGRHVNSSSKLKTADILCGDCELGTYIDNPEQRKEACQVQPSCGAGTYSDPAFHDSTTARRQCKQWSTCDHNAGETLVANGTATADTICEGGNTTVPVTGETNSGGDGLTTGETAGAIAGGVLLLGGVAAGVAYKNGWRPRWPAGTPTGMQLL